MKEMIKSELKNTMHTAWQKMKEINDMDIEDVVSDELHDLKNCVKILCHATELEKELEEKK